MICACNKLKSSDMYKISKVVVNQLACDFYNAHLRFVTETLESELFICFPSALGTE